MIHSMTGYGRAVQTRNGKEITVELRAVNNRFLDCSIKLPRAYSYAEDAVKQTVKKQVSRGKVDVFINIQRLEEEAQEISVNRSMLEGYLNALRQISREYELPDDITASTVLRLPEVFRLTKAQEDEAQCLADIVEVTKQAVQAFNAMRATEGAAMETDLRSRAQTVLELVTRVEQRSPISLQEYRSRLLGKMQEVLSNTALDESRILTEVAIYADRIAVDEETVRLRSHVAQLLSLLDAGGELGRKLDFLLQEMNRESNTIGSKGNDIEQARTVVELKCELEKIREQIQNIE